MAESQRAQEIGVFHTKTHLSEILERVERGETFYITRRGRRVALLKPLERRRAITPGCARNPDFRMSEDFDATPEDFDDYL